MKQSMITALALMLGAAQANAAINVVVRSDYYNNSKYTNTSNADVAGSSVLAPAVARLNFSTTLGDAKIYTGLNFRSFDTATSTSIAGGSATSDAKRVLTVDRFVENIYIVKPLGPLMVSVGKLEANVGGFERRHIITGDTYMASLANGSTLGLISSLGTQSATTYINPENSSGVEISYPMGDHKIGFQVLNQTNAASASASGTTAGVPSVTKANNKRHSMGLQYEGSFADGMVMPILSYMVGAADTVTYNGATGAATSSSGVDQKFMNAGVKLNLPADIGLMAEYFKNTSKDDAANAKEDSTTSMVITARYKHPEIQPILSFESSENKIDEDSESTGSFKRTGISAAVEYTPKADENFRYHAAYNTITDKYGKPGLSNDSVTASQFIVGIKYSGDFLK